MYNSQLHVFIIGWMVCLNMIMKTTSDISHENNPDLIIQPRNFKFYIYDLPSAMNSDIVNFANKNYGLKNCMSLRNDGMGDELFKIGDNNELSIRNTDQFALEVIIHRKLMRSSYRTLNPEKADIFYIPAYIGTHCIFNNKYYFTKLSEELILNLTDFLHRQKYFREGKPHFSTISKIHKEMASEFCPYLQYEITKNVTFLSIEKETPREEGHFMTTAAQFVNVIPYPSFVHLVPENLIDNKLPIPDLNHRDVFIFLPAGSMCTNDLRCDIMKQFAQKTKLSYTDFKKEKQSTDMVLLEVQQCDDKTDRNIVPWMQHSVFCLQPPGDSPTRKSFYDSLTSGCIPVIFGNHSLHYAFSSYLNFSQFTVSIPTDIVSKSNNAIKDYLRAIDKDKIADLHTNLLNIIKYMQYSITDSEVEEPNDALKLIFTEIADKLIPKS